MCSCLLLLLCTLGYRAVLLRQSLSALPDEEERHTQQQGTNDQTPDPEPPRVGRDQIHPGRGEGDDNPRRARQYPGGAAQGEEPVWRQAHGFKIPAVLAADE